MNNKLFLTEKKLLHQISVGNERAFRQLFDKYWKNIYGLALSLTKSPLIADEIVQDIFLKVWLNRQNLTEIKKFDCYLFTIARNHIFNELRKKIKEEPYSENSLNDLPAFNNTPEHLLIFKETEYLINNAITQLPPQQQAIYSLSRQQGLTQEEIATRLHISKNTVKSHMNKALRFIKRYLIMHLEEISFILCIIYFYH